MESLGIFIVTLPLQLINSIGYYKLFVKAGKPGWLAFIPYWNSVIENDIIGRPRIEVFLELVPFVNIYVYVRNMVELLRCYGEERSLHKTLAIVWGWIYLPIFASKSKTTYLGPISSLPKIEKPKSVAREWWDAVLFAVVAATLIRWLIMEAYTIPTPSMENSLLVGDFLFVSKFHYGTRTPRTPLQIPLTHQKIWFTDIPSYIPAIQLPTFRLPGISEVKREDVVVFNVPGIEENNYPNPNSAEWIDYPVDLKTNYIKRCVAIAGDVIQIKNHEVYVNGAKLADPPGLQLSYQVIAKDEINQRNLDKLDIDPEDAGSGARINQDSVVYTMSLTEEKAQQLRALPYIISATAIIRQNPEWNIYPTSKLAPWNADFYGPLTIPKKGMKITINDSTLAFYGKMIRLYDHNEDVKIENGKLTIEGKEVTEYTFNQNYYFMMGDNRHNSLDSRYWGFVPEDHIVGKAFFIWLSLDKHASFINKIRWSRFFKLIR